MLRAVGRRMPDLVRLGEAVEAARPSVPHWYLSHLGVDPDRQGHGLGSALLRAMPPTRDGLPAYLECKPAHVGYYARFGFAVSGEVVVDPTLSLVTMWRPGGG
jgi:predicted N-acetyltransferase YhbS